MAAKKTSAKSTPVRNRIPPILPEEPEVDEDEDEDEDEEEADEAPRLAVYDPATHVCIPAETFHALVRSKEEMDQRSLVLVQADAKKTESLVMGFSTNTEFMQGQLTREREFSNQQRELADGYRKQLVEKEMEISKMIRQSEDAKLERERLAAELRRGSMANEQLQMQLNNKLQQRKAELDAVRTASAPVFAAAGQGLQALIMSQMGKMLSGGSAPGVAAGGAPGEEQGEPEVRLSLDNTAQWKVAFTEAFNQLSPEGLASLRAIVCSYLIPGAPKLPQEVLKNLGPIVQRDAGDERVMMLFQASMQAYVVEEAPPAPRAKQETAIN